MNASPVLISELEGRILKAQEDITDLRMDIIDKEEDIRLITEQLERFESEGP